MPLWQYWGDREGRGKYSDQIRIDEGEPHQGNDSGDEEERSDFRNMYKDK